MKLGRRAPKRAPAIQFANIWTRAVPPYPPMADHFSRVNTWELGANDQFGTCGPTSVANSRHLITQYLALQEEATTVNEVFDLYRRSGNPGFNPNTGAGDGGVDMQTMLEEVQRNGIGGKKCLAFAQVNPKSLDELKAAISIFGFVLQGVTLQSDQEPQTAMGVWDYSPSGPWGGHAVLSGYYGYSQGNPADLRVITWKKIVGETDQFILRQLDEAWVVIWPEALGTRQFQESIDKAALASAYQSLTGRTFPMPDFPPIPDPVPPVPPVPPPIIPGTLQQQVDQWFDAAIAKFSRRPFIRWALSQVKILVDQWFAANPTFVTEANHRLNANPSAFHSIMDKVFEMIEASAPLPYRQIILFVQAIFDTIVP